MPSEGICLLFFGQWVAIDGFGARSDDVNIAKKIDLVEKEWRHRRWVGDYYSDFNVRKFFFMLNEFLWVQFSALVLTYQSHRLSKYLECGESNPHPI